jgi:hypothetical protein
MEKDLPKFMRAMWHLLQAINHWQSMAIGDFSGSDIIHASLADGVKS